MSHKGTDAAIRKVGSLFMIKIGGFWYPIYDLAKYFIAHS